MISSLRIPIFSYALFNTRMKTIDEIHRDNLAILVKDAGGVGELAKILGRQDSQVSQWLNGSLNSKTGKPRGPNPSSCRRIEEKCEKPKGWMDQDHSSEAAPRDNVALMPNELMDLLSMYSQLDHEGREAILKMARGLLQTHALAATARH